MDLIRDKLAADHLQLYKDHCKRSAHALFYYASTSPTVLPHRAVCNRHPNHYYGDMLAAAKKLWDYVLVSPIVLIVSI